MFYSEIMEGLFREKVRYLIVGGLAVNLHGVPRVTQDIDVIIATDRDNVERLITMLNGLGYKAKLPVDPMGIADTAILKDWMENRNLKAFSFYHEKISYKMIDIVLDHAINFSDAYERKTRLEVDHMSIDVISIGDLIRMKREAGRPRDLSDVAMLEEAERISRKK